MDYSRAITLTKGKKKTVNILNQIYIDISTVYHVSLVLHYIYTSFNML